MFAEVDFVESYIADFVRENKGTIFADDYTTCNLEYFIPNTNDQKDAVGYFHTTDNQYVRNAIDDGSNQYFAAMGSGLNKEDI